VLAGLDQHLEEIGVDRERVRARRLERSKLFVAGRGEMLDLHDLPSGDLARRTREHYFGAQCAWRSSSSGGCNPLPAAGVG
jgi:hypothetical protein